MSQIENVITTTLRARGGNVISQMGQWSQGFGMIGGKINDTTRMSERLNNQWRAIGTTFRYAIAGSVIFGLTRMLGQVKDLNVQLGQMQAISGIGPGTAFSNRDINTLFGNLQNVANDTITPLNEVNDAAVNFLSTVQNVKPSELPTMLDEIARGAKIAQVSTEDLTQAATTMQIAFGRKVNPGTIGQFSRMFQTLIGIAPGGITAGPAITQAMPGLASMFQLAPGRQPAAQAQAQMMGLTLGVLRTGMPPATAMRGLTYLLQSIAQPTGGARQALAGIGITPQFVQQKGIFAGVMRLLNTITKTGNAQQLGAIPDDTLDQLDASGGSLPGIPAAEMGRLREMIPRIHGIRAAIILASQLKQQGDVSSIMQDVNIMQQAQDVNSQQTKQLAQAWSNFRKRSRLAEAANAINTMQLQVAQTFEPVLGFVAQHVIDPVTHAAQRHQTTTKVAAIAGASFLAALGVGKFLGVGRFGGSAFVKATAAEAALSGNTVLGGSPQNPLYVIVVGQIFGGGSTIPTSKGGLIKDAEDVAKAGLGMKLARGAFGLARGAGGFLSRLGMGGTRLGLGGVAGLAALWAMAQSGEQGTQEWSPTGRPYAKLGKNLFEYPKKTEHMLELHRAQEIWGRQVKGFNNYGVHEFKGRAEIFLTLDQVDASGRHTTKRVHIPLDMWSGGRVPVTTGKVATTRRGK